MTLSNDSGEPLTIVDVITSGPGLVTSARALPLTIAPGGSASLSIDLAPATTGDLSGSVSFLAANRTDPVAAFRAVGRGVRPITLLAAAPSTAAFGDVAVGSSAKQTITVTNGGSSAVSVASLSVSAAGVTASGLALPFTFGPGQSATFDLTFAPTSAGAVSGSVALRSDQGRSVTVVDVSGSGVSPAGPLTLAAAPTRVDFGQVTVGSFSAQGVTLANTSSQPITVSEVVTTGTGFTVSGLAAGTTIAAGASQTITARFTPSAAGTASGQITVRTAGQTEPLASVDLAGSGVAAASITSVTVRDATVEASKTVQVQADVVAVGTIDKSVTWSVDPGSLGSIDPVTGVYSAPSTPGTYRVWATSNADSSKKGVGSVTVTSPPVSSTPPPAPSLPPGVVPAFPGAEGGGAGAKGGRGGAVIKVTNLNDSGAGSLRACATASGPRTCVFTVGGVINLLSTIHINNPYLTIAGQTAPGGIAVYTGRGTPVSGREVYAFSVEASDVVIRYLRIWGDTVPNQGAPAALGSIAVMVYEPRVIVDHVTALWQTGYSMAADVGGVNNGANLTLQWNLMGENIINTTNYPNGQSTPLLLLSDGSHSGNMWDPYGVTDMDLHHNLIANADHRLPGMCAQTGRVINNAIYNWGRMEYVDTGTSSMISADFIGNHYKPGPWNGGQGPGGAGYREIMANRGSVASGSSPTFSLYVSGNQSDWRGWDSSLGDRGAVSASASDATQWSMLTSGSASYQGATAPGYLPLPSTYKRSPWGRLPPPASQIDITVDGVTSLPSILTAAGGVGASRYLSCNGTWVNLRDSAENRIINNYLNGTGPSGPPTSAASANGGALPTLTPGAACTDGDGDGVPDAYETAHGLNPNDASDAARVASDGYTNLEHYLNGQ